MNNSEPIFVGEFTHSVDGKGRVAVPNAFRRKFAPDEDGKLVLARAPNRCIEVHTLGEWVEHVNKTMKNMSLYRPQARRLRRARLSQAREVDLDGQGRILVPKNLKDLAGITGEAVIIGVGPFFEMWEPGRYREYLGRADEQYDEDLAELDEPGRESGPGAGHDEGRGHLSPAGDGA